MADRPASSDEYVLLVEGPDDKHVVRHLCRSDSGIPIFRIRKKGSVNELLRGIPGEVLAEGRTVVGILVDANDNLQARWQAVSDRLRGVDITLPACPEPNGTIVDFDGRPRVGVWLMPDNISPGELEDFVASLIPAQDPVWPLSEGYIDGIPEVDRKFKQGKVLRAKVHAWLASRSSPRRMGTAIGARDLNVELPECRRFVNWLRELFK